MRLPNRKLGIFVAAVVGATASTIVATPSFAVSVSCTVPASERCSTGILSANRTGHFIDYTVCVKALFGTTGYAIMDIDTGVIVKNAANSLRGCDSDRVTGLYGRYRLTLVGDPGSTGTIDNI